MDAAALASNVERALLLQTRRALRAILARPAAMAKGLAVVRDVEARGAEGPLRARYYEPANAAPGPLLLYFHGGGFVCCDIDTHDSICSHLAQASRARVVSVGYRLAPEAAFPAQIDDARAACDWALHVAESFGAQSGRLVLSGDSAGGYLAAYTAVALNREKPGTVALQALFYPLVHVEDTLWAQEELRNFRFLGRLACLYIAAKLGAEKLPALTDLDLRHAPTTIIAGGGPLDPVRADVRSLSGALREAGVRVIERKYPILWHGGLNFTSIAKVAVTALGEVGAAVRSELDALR